MNILALDQARNGAWSVFNYETKELVQSGYFSFNPHDYTYEKAIMHIEELLDILIKAFDIEAVFVEDIQLRGNVQAFKKLAQLQGVLINYLEKNEFLYDTVAPSQWQNYCAKCGENTPELDDYANRLRVTGKKKSKIQSLVGVKRIFDKTIYNDDVADAILIGHYVVNNIKIETKKTRRKSNGKSKK